MCCFYTPGRARSRHGEVFSTISTSRSSRRLRFLFTPPRPAPKSGGAIACRGTRQSRQSEVKRRRTVDDRVKQLAIRNYKFTSERRTDSSPLCGSRWSSFFTHLPTFSSRIAGFLRWHCDRDSRTNRRIRRLSVQLWNQLLDVITHPTYFG